ncbi:MAG: isoprenylcysteine carboxylmethyltransferase family protein [Terracidiphilus sp.]|jgi:protein-S-isoprenylcysteine O-methyltransferase Ste14
MAASIKMALIAIASVVFQFGLAIFGEGGFSAFFSHPALIGLAVATFVLTVVALFAGGNLSSGEQEDRGNRWVLAAFSVIAILIAYLPAYTDRKGIWVLDGESLRWVGVALLTAGAALRVWPVFVLGRRFSGLVAIQAGHTLVTDGVYSRIRNPSYLGLLISTLGWALAFRSIVGVILALLTIPPLVARMNAEERLLSSHFGSEYEAYRSRTARLIPGIY